MRDWALLGLSSFTVAEDQMEYMGPVAGRCNSMVVRVCGSSLLATYIFSVEYLAGSSWGNNIGGLKKKGWDRKQAARRGSAPGNCTVTARQY